MPDASQVETPNTTINTDKVSLVLRKDFGDSRDSDLIGLIPQLVQAKKEQLGKEPNEGEEFRNGIEIAVRVLNAITTPRKGEILSSDQRTGLYKLLRAAEEKGWVSQAYVQNLLHDVGFSLPQDVHGESPQDWHNEPEGALDYKRTAPIRMPHESAK